MADRVSDWARAKTTMSALSIVQSPVVVMRRHSAADSSANAPPVVLVPPKWKALGAVEPSTSPAEPSSSALDGERVMSEAMTRARTLGPAIRKVLPDETTKDPTLLASESAKKYA